MMRYLIRKNSKGRIKLAGICLLLIFLMVLLATTSVIAQEKIPIRIAWQPAEELRFYAAKALGLFEKEGLAPEYSYFAAGPPMFAAFASKSVDVGYMWLAPVIIGRAQDIDWRVIMVEGDGPETEGLVVRNDSGIKSGNDLKGKKIAVTKGTSADYAFGKVLEKFKLKRTDVNILDVVPANVGPAFEKKDVDGVYIWEPWLHKLAEKNGKIIFTDKDVNVPGTGVWVARKEFIEKNPEGVQRFLAALDKATESLKKDPAPAINEIMSRLAVDKPTAQHIYDKTYLPTYKEQLDPKYAVSMYPDSHLGKTLKEMANFLKEVGRITAIPDVDKIFDTTPLKAYLEKKK